MRKILLFLLILSICSLVISGCATKSADNNSTPLHGISWANTVEEISSMSNFYDVAYENNTIKAKSKTVLDPIIKKENISIDEIRYYFDFENGILKDIYMIIINDDNLSIKNELKESYINEYGEPIYISDDNESYIFSLNDSKNVIYLTEYSSVGQDKQSTSTSVYYTTKDVVSSLTGEIIK